MHKIGSLYFTILNLPPKFRSSLSNCYLVGLYNASDVKNYGFDHILQPLVKDTKELEGEGIHISTNVFEGQVRAGIAQVTGDNLGVNGICGFVESFVSHHFCRHCKMHINQMRNAQTECHELLRTQQNYEDDVEIRNPTETGIKALCCLNNVEHFQVATNHAPDVMHDILEGVCGVEIHLVLASLIHEGFFDLDTLNSRLTSFDYSPCDSKNKPSPIDNKKLQNPDGAPGQTAAQMWCLVRYLPLIIGDLVPENNQYLELILLLLECMDFIFCPEITREETIFLKQMIKDHHEHFLALYQDRRLKPKHHFMIHYPRQMRLLGPVVNFWAMRFEAKHRFFKRLGHIVCNYQNILQTLAKRQQMFLCYNLMSRKDLADRDVEIGPGSTSLVVSLERAEFLSASINVHLFSEVYVATWCMINGIKYHRNLLVTNGTSSDNFPIFERIIYIICVEAHVKLVTEPCQTIKYDRHTHSYAVQQTAGPLWSIIPIEHLHDRQVFHADKTCKEGGPYSYFTMRYRIH